MVIEIILTILAVLLVGFLIAKKVNATIALLIGGLLILMIAPLLGHTGFGNFNVNPSGNAWIDQFAFMGQILATSTAGVGMIIMVLFGFAAYMTHIGANQMATYLLTRPLLRLRVKYLLVPFTFWLGNLMSLAVPSASALAVLLVATVLPALIAAGLKPITAAAVIATTATIMPTPLGGDNVIAAGLLGIPLDEYVFGMHALISIPTLLVMGIVHFFWQQYMDRRELAAGRDMGELATEDTPDDHIATDAPRYYAVFPILPLLFVLIPFLIRQFTPFNLNVELIPGTLIALLIAVIFQMIRTRSMVNPLEDMMIFFKGMGTGFFTVVALVVAANILVEAIIQIGVVAALGDAVAGMHGAGFILFLGFSGAMFILALLTGGVAPFFSLVNVAPPVAAAAGINGAILTLPMQFIGNLARAMSPVAAVVLIVAAAVKVNVGQLIARTAVPMMVGIIMSMILTWFIVGAY